MNSKRIPIDLLIFDFDGTLADSIPPAVEAIQQMLKELEYPYKSKEEINKHVGHGEFKLVAGSIGTENSAAVERAKEVYFNYYRKEFKTISLYPHVKEFLKSFKEKKMIIISNKKSEFINVILEHHKLAHHFAEVLGGDNATSLKPDPSAINNILKKYKIDPSRTIFIGDMSVDIETGKNAKVFTCAVSYGFEPRSELEKHNPNFLIDDLLELKKFIK